VLLRIKSCLGLSSILSEPVLPSNRKEKKKSQTDKTKETDKRAVLCLTALSEQFASHVCPSLGSLSLHYHQERETYKHIDSLRLRENPARTDEEPPEQKKHKEKTTTRQSRNQERLCIPLGLFLIYPAAQTGRRTKDEIPLSILSITPDVTTRTPQCVCNHHGSRRIRQG